MEKKAVWRKRRRRKLSPYAVIAVCLAVLFTSFCFINAALREPVMSIARERATASASLAVNEAVRQAAASWDTEELSRIERTGENTFVIRVDTARLNALVAGIAAEAMRRISLLGEYGVSVELGTASGVALLSGKGPCVNVGFRPEGSAVPSVGSSLRSAGINQSLFSVDLTLTVSIRLVMAGKTELVTVKNTVPVYETAIVGAVPQVYTNVANEDDMLNLIPTELP